MWVLSCMYLYICLYFLGILIHNISFVSQWVPISHCVLVWMQGKRPKIIPKFWANFLVQGYIRLEFLIYCISLSHWLDTSFGTRIRSFLSIWINCEIFPSTDIFRGILQVDCDKTIMVTFKHDDKFQEGTECAFQVSFLWNHIIYFTWVPSDAVLDSVNIPTLT